MYSGTMIADLMSTVERVEQARRPVAPVRRPVCVAAPQMQAFPAFSTFAYEWPQVAARVPMFAGWAVEEQAIVGAA